MHEELRYDDKVVIVTGAGGGLGREHALMFGKRGARLVVNDLGGDRMGDGRSSSAADRVVEEIRSAGGEAVANYDSVEDGARIVETALDAFGTIDVVINNAGILRDVSFHKMTDRDWDLIYTVHLKGSYKVCRAAWPHMRENRYGRIVNITMLWERGFPGMAHSVAARNGVHAMSKTLAVEWANRGIRINCVAPGYVASSGLKRYPKHLGVLERIQQVVPMKRLARREEIAWLVAYLVSPAGEYITGQVWNVDGGKELWGDFWPIPDPSGMTAAVPEVDPWETND